MEELNEEEMLGIEGGACGYYKQMSDISIRNVGNGTVTIKMGQSGTRCRVKVVRAWMNGVCFEVGKVIPNNKKQLYTLGLSNANGIRKTFEAILSGNKLRIRRNSTDISAVQIEFEILRECGWVKYGGQKYGFIKF